MGSRKESGSSSRSSTEVRIGVVGKPHGKDGGFHVLDATGQVALLEPGRTVSLAGRERTVVWRKGTAERPLLKLSGAEDRGAANELRGEQLTVPRSALGTRSEGEFLIDELIGCDAFDGEQLIGRVRDVLLLPSVDVLEVGREGQDDLLVPLVGDAVRSVDPDSSRIEIDMAFLDAD